MKRIIILATLVLLSIFAWRPLLHGGFFTIHDNQQIVRLQQLDKSLSYGQFPVRWVADLGFGFGYPLFNFYPPLVYYLGELFHLGLGTGFVDSIKLVWFVALVGSGLAMYFLAKEFFGKISGVVSAAFYIYAPYHAVDAFVRGALAELFSFVWLPLILLYSYKTVKEGKIRHATITGIFLALLMLTHNLIFLPFFGLYALWYLVIFLIFGSKKYLLSTFSFLLSSFLAFSLSAFFWLPALWEKQYTLVDQLLVVGPASYLLHFVCPNQLWDSAWGFGGSTAGCLDGLSFKIGKPHVLLSLLSFCLATLVYFRKKIRFPQIQKNAEFLRVSTTFFFLLSLFFLVLLSVFMTTPYSKAIWDALVPLQYLQFPWRFLEFVSLFCALLVGGLLVNIKRRLIKILVAMAIVSVIIFLHAKYFTPQEFLATNDQGQTSDFQTKWIVSGTSFEYLPKGVATKRLQNGAIWVDIDQSQIPLGKYQVLSGDMKVDRQQFAPDKFLISTTASQSSILQLNITNFPGWETTIDNQKVTPSDDNKYKLITITIPGGTHQVEGRFKNTPVRTVGNAVSFAALLAISLMAYATRRN